MMRLVITTVIFLLSAFVGQASGQVTGRFVQLEDGLATVAPGTPIDVYGFQITNDSGFDIFTFDTIGFSGELLQGGSLAKIGTGLEVAPGLNVADSFFTDDNVAPGAVGTVEDSLTSLYADSIATLGQAWVLDGTTETIAVFSVNQNAAGPVFNGGRAVVDGQFVNISSVPEPGSVIVLGLGCCALLARRRR